MGTRAQVTRLAAGFLLAGVIAGFLLFHEVADAVAPGVFHRLVDISERAEFHARWSFSIAVGLMFAATPMAAGLGVRFRRRGPFWKALIKTALTALAVAVVAALYHRSEMSTLAGKVGDVWSLASSSEKHVLWNPLTRSALAGAAGALVSGVLQAALFSSAVRK